MRTIDGENDLLLTCAHTQNGVAILRCETRDDTVRLPDELDGHPVTVLGDYALSERAPILTGRDTFAVRVTCGGPEPVHDANAVRRVILPERLQSIGSYAFYNCRELTSVELYGGAGGRTARGWGKPLTCKGVGIPYRGALVCFKPCSSHDFKYTSATLFIFSKKLANHSKILILLLYCENGTL